MSPGWKVPVNTIFKSFPASPSLPTVVRLIDKIKPLTSVEEVVVCVGIVTGRVPFCMLGATLFFLRLSVLFIVALFVGSTVVELTT